MEMGERSIQWSYDECMPEQRPKYGALNYKGLGAGASPRFGSSFFRLKSHVIKRTTFCCPDSFFDPQNFGTYQYLKPLIELANAGMEDELDSYIEAQIHGEIDINNDIEAIVLDPSYFGTDIENQALQLSFELQ